MEDSNDKVYGILSYFGILVLIPIIAGKTQFARFHANQGLILIIIEIIVGTICGVLSFIPVVRVIFGIISGLVGLVTLILAIMGIVSAANGEMKELPVIGSIHLLK